ncbi:MAG: rhodanese-like domain-containing protein [Pseudoxanthomonas sp.]
MPFQSLSAADLVQEARDQIREVSPTDYRPSDACVLIDVREPAEFDTGHIPGAINIPRGVLEFQVEAHPAVANVRDPALAQKSQPLLVYCRTGGRAALSALNLQRMGFTDVRSISGGITAWSDAGLPVVQR